MNKYEKNIKTQELIERYCKEGDVINTSGMPKKNAIHEKIVYWRIRTNQEKLFKNPHIIKVGKHIMNPNDDTHSMMYFKNSSIRKHIGSFKNIKQILKENKWGKVGSVEPPKATLIDTNELGNCDIRVYRYAKTQFTEQDVEILIKGWQPVLGTMYDIGQLMAIEVSAIAGYPHVEKAKWLDWGCERKVCSVQIAADFAYWRHELEKKGIYNDRLFSKLNNKNWNKNFIKKFKRWDVERTYPSMISNSQTHFDGEFNLLLWIYKGNLFVK